jgi:hypothetical protein
VVSEVAVLQAPERTLRESVQREPRGLRDAPSRPGRGTWAKVGVELPNGHVHGTDESRRCGVRPIDGELPELEEVHARSAGRMELVVTVPEEETGRAPDRAEWPVDIGRHHVLVIEVRFQAGEGKPLRHGGVAAGDDRFAVEGVGDGLPPSRRVLVARHQVGFLRPERVLGVIRPPASRIELSRIAEPEVVGEPAGGQRVRRLRGVHADVWLLWRHDLREQPAARLLVPQHDRIAPRHRAAGARDTGANLLPHAAQEARRAQELSSGDLVVHHHGGAGSEGDDRVDGLHVPGAAHVADRIGRVGAREFQPVEVEDGRGDRPLRRVARRDARESGGATR